MFRKDYKTCKVGPTRSRPKNVNTNVLLKSISGTRSITSWDKEKIHMQMFKSQAGKTTINIGPKHFNEVYLILVFFSSIISSIYKY